MTHLETEVLPILSIFWQYIRDKYGQHHVRPSVFPQLQKASLPISAAGMRGMPSKLGGGREGEDQLPARETGLKALA